MPASGLELCSPRHSYFALDSTGTDSAVQLATRVSNRHTRTCWWAQAARDAGNSDDTSCWSRTGSASLCPGFKSLFERKPNVLYHQAVCRTAAQSDGFTTGLHHLTLFDVPRDSIFTRSDGVVSSLATDWVAGFRFPGGIAVFPSPSTSFLFTGG